MAISQSDKTSVSSGNSPENKSHSPRTEKTIGFPKADNAPLQGRPTNRQQRPAASLRTRTVTPKRPKGRWFITLFICAIAFLAGSRIWTQFGQNRAYGIMEGRVIVVRVPWNGTIESMHVRDGQQVEQGQLLATINNFEFKNERLRLKHELEIALADLAMRVADVQSRDQARSDTALKLQIEYYQLLGRLHSERSKQEELAANFKTNQWLHSQDSFPRVELESNRIQLEGQKAVVTDLNEALTLLQSKLEQPGKQNDLILQPLILQQARIKSIESEFERLGQLACQGGIRAPVQGRVVRRHQFTGEFIEKNTILFEVLEQDSLEAVLYLPQSQANLLTCGDEVQLMLPPDSQSKTFTVDRFGEQMVHAPSSIQRYYSSRQRLIPVHAVPIRGQDAGFHNSDRWILGAEVRLPRFGYRAEAGNAETSTIAQLQQVLGY